MTEPTAAERKEQARRDIAEATPQSEATRVGLLAVEHGIEVPTTRELPLEDTDKLVRPAARLYATLASELRAVGIDPTPMLLDSRHDAIMAELARLFPMDLPPCDLVPAGRGFDRARVELRALRGVETPLLTTVANVRKAREDLERQALEEQAAADALSRLVLPEHVAAERAEEIRRGPTLVDEPTEAVT